jgi:hypothetical protein
VRGFKSSWARHLPARQRWLVRVTQPDGRRRTYYCRTEPDAKRKLRSLLAAIEGGDTLAREDVTLARLLTETYLPVDEQRRPLSRALLKGKPSHVSRTEEIIRLQIAPTTRIGLADSQSASRGADWGDDASDHRAGRISGMDDACAPPSIPGL